MAAKVHMQNSQPNGVPLCKYFGDRKFIVTKNPEEVTCLLCPKSILFEDTIKKHGYHQEEQQQIDQDKEKEEKAKKKGDKKFKKNRKRYKKVIKGLKKWRLKKPYGVSPTDDRHPQALRDLGERGFSNCELWNFYNRIAEFIFPRLLAFRQAATNEMTPDVDKMLAAFELIVQDKQHDNEENTKIVRKGLKAFHKCFFGLWY